MQAYVDASNITSLGPRQQILAFAEAVDREGLWNSMVCWPLRSSQNSGSGTTAFSLGGLVLAGSGGRLPLNGTLIDGPTWGASGVSFASANQRMTTEGASHNPSQVASTLVAVFTPSLAAASVIVDMNHLRLRRGGVTYAIQVNLSVNVPATTNVGTGALVDVPAFLAGSFSLSNRFAMVDGAQSSVLTASLFNGDCSSFALNAASSVLPGTVSFAAYFRGSALTFEQLQAFRTIYKNTLGQGLTGLP